MGQCLYSNFYCPKFTVFFTVSLLCGYFRMIQYTNRIKMRLKSHCVLWCFWQCVQVISAGSSGSVDYVNRVIAFEDHEPDGEEEDVDLNIFHFISFPHFCVLLLCRLQESGFLFVILAIEY